MPIKPSPQPRRAFRTRFCWFFCLLAALSLLGAACNLPITTRPPAPPDPTQGAAPSLELPGGPEPSPTIDPFAVTYAVPPELLTPPVFPTATPALVGPTLDPALFYTPTPVPTETPAPTPTPLPPTPTPQPNVLVRFAVIGDFGLAGQPAEDVANLIDSWDVNFIITVGDNNYPNGASNTIDENIGQYYHEYIFPYTGRFGEGSPYNRFFPTLGNHEYVTLNAAPHLEYFTLPGNERYYDFTWGPLHLFALNSDSHEPDGVGRSSAQAAWLQAAMSASTAPWQIVYFHHAPYSSGTHGGTDWMRWPFVEWGADAVLAGHDHTYERFDIEGIPYFVNGLGGGPRYSQARVEPGSQVQFESDYGAMLVTADNTFIKFEFVTRAGLIVDQFTVYR